MALPRVFFDLTAGGNPVGRITMEVRLKFCVFWPSKFERKILVQNFKMADFAGKHAGALLSEMS